MSTAGQELISRPDGDHSMQLDGERAQQDTAHNVCLCQPDPKIPRPRNSFILFRQAQQAKIIAQNPGIPNPEVSKIIGKQWQHLSVEAKEEWNTLAEIEKARHQEQYPGYRYHPRRSGRNSTHSSVSGPSSTELAEPCSKCGKKPISQPLHSPAAAPIPQNESATRDNMTIQVPAKRGFVVNSGHPQRLHHGQPTVSPEHHGQQKAFVEAYPFSRVDPRLIYAVPPTAQRTPPSESQEAKRRRYDSNGVYVASGQAYPEPQYAYPHSPSAAYPRGEQMRQIHAPHIPLQRAHPVQMTKPALISPPRGIYPLPPQLQPVRPPPIQQQRARTSVALPPIETMVSPFSAKPASVSTSQSSGVEAMIMSIPVLNRIRVLSQISSPLPSPGLSSPKLDVRGAIIAIEGMDAASVMSMSSSLADQLEKEGNFAVKIFEGPNPYQLMREARNVTTRHHKNLTTETYLQMLSEWHKINKEMVEYITTKYSQTGSRNAPIAIESSPLIPTKVAPTTDNLRPSSPRRKSNAPVTESEDLMEDVQSAISPKTIVRASELSIISPPPPPKTRSQSLAEENDKTDVSKGPGQRLPSLSFPRPTNSSRIPPPPPTPPIPPPPTTRPLSRVPPPRKPSASTLITNVPPVEPMVEVDQLELKGNTKETPALTSPNATGTTSAITAAPPTSTISPNAIPIAIVPHFQLTTVDASSISMPISDGFSPPAHWQWFATLWRGSVGPDVTIVIKSTDEELVESVSGASGGATATAAPNTTATTGPGATATAGPGNGSTSTSVNPSIPSASKPLGSISSTNQSKPGASSVSASTVTTVSAPTSTSGVEVRLHDCRAVIVKTGIFGAGLNSGSKPAGLGCRNVSAKEMESWEKSKRRVGFEVEEFLRR